GVTGIRMSLDLTGWNCVTDQLPVHTGGPGKHQFMNDIIILGVKAMNKYNTYSIYKACDEALGWEEALKNPVTNKKNTVQNHLKKCEYFCAKLGSQEAVDAYCNKTNNEADASQSSKKCQNTNISDDDIHISDITTKEKFKFEQLLLQMTILNEWAFQWTTNPATQEFLINLIMSREQKLKEDSIGVTLAFDKWKNVLKQHIFGSLFILSTGKVQIWEESNEFKIASKQAITIVSYFNNAIHSYFIGKLRESLIKSCQALRVWFGCRPICILLELEEYRKQNYPFDLTTYEQFGENILEFWKFASSSTRELGPLAIHLFGICINAASVADEPTDEPTNELELNKYSTDTEQDELQDIKPSSIITPDNWKNQLCDWEQMLIDEEITRSEDEEAERDNDNMEGNLLSDYIHPAINNRAKWELSDIFSLLFQKSNFMNSNDN
ncbi:4170_t:CDS:2, partial [Ambispora gerdemannii]